MKISSIAQSPSFSRALSLNEEKELKKLTNSALKNLGIDTISTTVFDFSVPMGDYNTGIGTTFSKEGINTAEFANTYFGTTNIQVGPQGEVSDFIRSPYSGTNFSLGKHIISPERLATKAYGNILSVDDLDDSSYMNDDFESSTVDYKHVFSNEDGIDSILAVAYENFKSLPKTSKLKKDFEQFKKDNEYWLERDSIYEALSYYYDVPEYPKWDLRDQNIYADENNIDYDRIEEIKNFVDDNGNNIVDYNEFVQFIADKQQQQTKAELNKMGIELSGDCQIGFPQKEVWAHKSAFYKNGEMFGCDRDGDGKFITCWTPAADMNKLDGETGELFRQKFATQFKRNNAVRIDAAWQLINPTIVKPLQKDEYGNMRGEFVTNQPEVGTKIINILKQEAAKAGVSDDKICLELLDGAGKSWKALNNYKVKDAIKNMNCIHTMQYMSNNWGYPGFYRSDKAGVFKHSFEISIGTHDDKTAHSCAEHMNNEQIEIMARELKKDKSTFSGLKDKIAGLYAMLFTNTPKNNNDSKGKVSMTINDAVGSTRRINVPNTQDGNWEYRLGRNWQEEYFKNLTDNIGFNLPETLSTAIKAKEGSSELTNKLDNYAQVLKSSNGPMNRNDAEKMAQNGSLNTLA